MKVSLIVTVLNEEKSIDSFLDSVANQSLKPDEIIIVDGGSVDWTLDKLSKRKENIRILIKEGASRSEGRNLAVEKAKNEIIAITDAGCILDKDWLAEIVKPFSDSSVDVVAGYYRGIAKTVFEKCVIPYALVMPDRVNPETFLPASRSMAIKKDVFWKVGGFPVEFVHNEDYVFANRLKKEGVKIVFCEEAIVNWIPRSNLKSFWTMIYRFALGDAESHLRHLKVFGIFLRYFIFISLLISSALLLSLHFLLAFVLLLILYLIWSVAKNYRYVKDIKAFFWLPVLQLTSDFAVIDGTIRGMLFSQALHKSKNFSQSP
jgi:glycosyltransferase involved in cell wall biosynthesis